jgi:hypothetical protein
MAFRGLLLAVAVLVAACGGGAGSEVAVPTTTTTTSTTTTTIPPTTTTTAPPPPTRQVAEPGWTPFATAGGITLVHPAGRVERIGFHESNHEGAQPFAALPTAVVPIVMEARERGNGGVTAADVVVDPAVEIRAPVTGRVKRAGTYVLYCKHSDDYVVIAPDERPTLEVKLLHIDGVRVRAGDRVVAGQTVLAPNATPLPFESQVDELRTVDPAWPHVHIEVVDPTIRNRPNPNSGC